MAPSWVQPTAVHAEALEQDRPVICRMYAPAGFGLGCSAQEVPFQTSARVTSEKLLLM